MAARDNASFQRSETYDDADDDDEEEDDDDEHAQLVDEESAAQYNAILITANVSSSSAAAAASNADSMGSDNSGTKYSDSQVRFGSLPSGQTSAFEKTNRMLLVIINVHTHAQQQPFFHFASRKM